MKYGIRILVILAMSVGIVFLNGEVAKSQDVMDGSVFNHGKRAQNQQEIDDSLLNFPDAEPKAVVAGRWFAEWQWDNEVAGYDYWDIVHRQFFFSINSLWGDEFGMGITFGPVVVWRFSADCKPYYVGHMNPEGDFMNGTMRCSDGSQTGSWEATYEGPLP